MRGLEALGLLSRADMHAVLGALHELDGAVGKGEQGVVFATAHVLARRS